jgi:hypothetical protein
MAEERSERMEEFLLIVGDTWRGENKRWLLALVIVVVFAWPVYFALKLTFANVFIADYDPPQVKAQVERVPLEVTETRIFKLDSNNYTGYVKVKNENVDWGVPKLYYRADFKDYSGVLLKSNTGLTYVRPSSEKVIVLPRFSSSASSPPTQIDFQITDSKFTITPDEAPTLNFDLQRTEVISGASDTAVTSVLRNPTPYKISQVDITVYLYDRLGKLIGVNFTNVNEIKSMELRSFRVVWPVRLGEGLRAEITAETNLFNKDLILPADPVSPFK